MRSSRGSHRSARISQTVFGRLADPCLIGTLCRACNHSDLWPNIWSQAVSYASARQCHSQASQELLTSVGSAAFTPHS